MHVSDLFDLSGKVALVTGGSRGLGLEIATGLAEAGAHVAITARREAWLHEADQALRKIGVSPLVLQCDVSKSEEVDAAVASTLKQCGRIDILVNNAGISWGAPPDEMPLEKWRSVMDVNAMGTFLMSQAVGRGMVRAGSGKIINVASIAGLLGSPSAMLDAIGYSASKGAVISFTRDLAVKWGPHGINVNAIAPGYFPTRMSEGVLARSQAQIEASIPLGRVGAPGELKGAAIFLASRASDYVTGQVLVVDGGYSAW